ncbi:hypothetical protein BDV97DRAFT_345325 [Delphinella strobiligena]|nr:hypothetical protein BDV97DRAFT_345325 [Delphinella strobiligena]
MRRLLVPLLATRTSLSGREKGLKVRTRSMMITIPSSLRTLDRAEYLFLRRPILLLVPWLMIISNF